MSRPVVSQVAEEVYERLAPFAVEDEDNGWPLLKFIEAWQGTYFSEVFEWVTDKPGMPGWGILMDPTIAPEDALPWLAQFAGVRLRDSMSVAEKRAAIMGHEGFDRGTVAAIRQAAQRALTGTKTVTIRERQGGAYRIQIRTYTPETPDEAAVLREILTQKPAGLVLDYDSIVGQDWGQVDTDFATWGAVDAAYGSWDEVRLDT